MVFDKYLVINERIGMIGQNSNGVWLCKELPFPIKDTPKETASDVDNLMTEICKVLNKHNKSEKEKPEKKEKRETNGGVKGLE